MTEDEWRVCGSTWPMLDHLKTQGSERKLRLLACLCCRRIWHLIPVEETRHCVEVAELYAEGLVSREGLAEAIQESMVACAKLPLQRKPGESEAINAVSRVHRSVPGGRNPTHGLAASAWATSEATRTRRYYGELAEEFEVRRQRFFDEEFARQAEFIREIFGNPFRPVTVDPAWRTSDVRLLAAGIYDEKAFDRLPILADALHDAGCDNDDILNHLRDATATHVRGCWALDLVLGKE